MYPNLRNTLLTAAIALAAFGALTWRNSANASGASAPVVVIALAKVKPGGEAAFHTAVGKILTPTRREDGNLSYVYHQAEDSTVEFAFVEQWRDDGSIAAHMQSPHMQQFFKKVGSLFEPGFPQIKKYHTIEK